MHNISDRHLDYHLSHPRVIIQNCVLKSTEFDDIFFSNHNGLDESRYVFCEGTDLANVFQNEQFVTIAELGFGTGLNLIAAIDLHRKLKSNCRVSYISFEAYPLMVEHLQIAHQSFQEIQEFSRELIRNWPKRWPGAHKFTMENDFFHVYLYYGDACQQLAKMNFRANIWFLDGFCPKKNTALWNESIMTEVARCSSSEAKIATFSVASQVKKNLQLAGCKIQKRPGFGMKREVLTAIAPSKPTIYNSHPKKVIIIGGGIAGASIAHALHIRGIEHIIVEQGSCLAPQASGNPVGMQYAKVSSWESPITRFYASALSYASSLSKNFDCIAKQGSIMLPYPEQESIRNQKILSRLWPNDLVCKVEKQQVQDYLGLEMNNEGIYQEASAAIFPGKLVEALSQKSQVLYNSKVVSINNIDNGVTIFLESGEILNADALVLAVGPQLPYFLQLLNMPSSSMEISKGQLSSVKCYEQQNPVHIPMHYGGYIIPSVNDHHYFGATFDKKDISIQNISDSAHQYNLDIMPETIKKRLNIDISTMDGRVSQRLSSIDRLPCVGKLAENIYGICALGSKGMTTAPILAEVLVSMLSPYPSILDVDLIKLLGIQKIFKKSKASQSSGD